MFAPRLFVRRLFTGRLFPPVTGGAVPPPGLLPELASALAGLGAAVWAGELPPESSPALALLELEGRPAWRAFEAALADDARVEVLARAGSYAAAEALLGAARARFEAAPSRLLGATYLAIVPGPSYTVGADARGRHVVGLTLACLRAREA